MTTALFIGRFQPFHLGHLDALRQIQKECNKIIIMIGSSQYSKTENNPLTAEKRENIIKKVLKEENIKATIFKIDDINNNDKWVDYISSILPKYDVVYTSNSLVEKLMKEKGKKVINLKFNIKTNGTEIRYLKKEGKKYKQFIHNSTISF